MLSIVLVKRYDLTRNYYYLVSGGWGLAIDRKWYPLVIFCTPTADIHILPDLLRSHYSFCRSK